MPFIVIIFLIGLMVGTLLGIIAWFRTKRLSKHIEKLEINMRQLRDMMRQSPPKWPDSPKTVTKTDRPEKQPSVQESRQQHHQQEPIKSDQESEFLSVASTPTSTTSTPVAVTQARDNGVQLARLLSLGFLRTRDSLRFGRLFAAYRTRSAMSLAMANSSPSAVTTPRSIIKLRNVDSGVKRRSR